jgi:hypothetical protein
MFWIANPINLPYMELMWGAPLLYRENGFWPGQPVPKDIPVIIKEAQRNGTVRAEDQWADLYIEYCRYLADISKGRFAVGQSVLRGPSDILLTLRGSEQGVLDYYDRGDEVHALFESYTDSFCALMDRMFSVLDPLEGGYCIAAMDQLWAPGRFVRLQEDAYSLLNPDIYREFLLPYNRRICKTFDYTVFHLHSAFTELLDDLLTIEELRAVQVTVDSKGPKLSDLTEPLLKIQNAGKKLVLRGEFSGKDLNFLSCLLNPSGVFITTMIETKEGKTNENQKKAV